MHNLRPVARLLQKVKKAPDPGKLKRVVQKQLDRDWEALMALCAQERELTESGEHPKVLRHVKGQLEEHAAAMGFSRAKIVTRDFRARKDGGRIVAIDKS